MDDPRPRPAALSAPPPQRLVLCLPCRHTGQPCRPGLALIERLRAAVAAARPGGDFEISGSASLAGCAQPCTAAWRASVGAAWFFGDVGSGDLGALVDLAAAAERGDPPPADPAGQPAAIIVARAGAVQ